MRSRLAALAIGVIGGVGGGMTALASADGPSSSAVWRLTRTFGANGGAPDEVVEGLGVVELADGSFGEIDPVTMTDADGRLYASVGGVEQAVSGEPWVATAEVLPVQVTQLTEEEREAEFLLTDPAADLAAFRTARASAAIIPEPPLFIDPAISAWLASGTDTMEVAIVLREQVPLDLPASGLGIDASVLLDLELQEQRMLALEAYRTAVESTQTELLSVVEGGGGLITGRSWTVNRFHAVVSPALAQTLTAREDVARIEVPVEYDNDTNTGDVIRHKIQVDQYLEQGFDGSVASGRSTATNMLVGVIDTVFDEDHPGWNDRRFDWRSTRTGVWSSPNPAINDSATSSTPIQHGGMVVSALLADLTQGQDPGLSTLQRKQRTGTSTESSLLFFESGEPITVSRLDALEEAANFPLDVLNMSRSCEGSPSGPCTWCDVDSSELAKVDFLYHQGVFVVNTGGNYYTSGGGCYVALPGTAAGSFTPAALNANVTANLHTADLTSGSSGGTDVHGRKMVDLAAPSGREGTTMLAWNNGYTTGGFGTSIAAPHIAGAAANLKHLNVDIWGTALANDVGNLYAQMLLMGDGATGATTFNTNGIDSRWGAGRMRMRMWEPEGMDSSYRMRFGNVTLSDGGTHTVNVNPDAGGTNQAIPAAADRLRVAVWWYEPNVGSAETPATISGYLIKRTTLGGIGAITYTSTDIGVQHHGTDAPSGSFWELKLSGANIPSSTDGSDPLYLQQKRKVYWAMYYEDRARDDVEGPDCCDEIDMDYSTCCALAGSVCPAVCP